MWGTASVKALCRHARTLGHTTLALTDTDNLYGMWPFITACKNEGIIPVIGAEITDPNTPHRAVCLVKTSRGYSNLSQMLTQRHRNNAFTLKDRLPEYSNGLVV